MANIEGARPIISLRKENKAHPQNETGVVVSRDGIAFDKRNIRSGEVLVARDENEFSRPPTFRLAKAEEKKSPSNQSNNEKRPIVSESGEVFVRRNARGGEVLVAQSGDVFSRPTFKMPEGSANRMPPEGIDD